MSTKKMPPKHISQKKTQQKHRNALTISPLHIRLHPFRITHITNPIPLIDDHPILPHQPVIAITFTQQIPLPLPQLTFAQATIDTIEPYPFARLSLAFPLPFSLPLAFPFAFTLSLAPTLFPLTLMQAQLTLFTFIFAFFQLA
jgi:hypothetical protein